MASGEIYESERPNVPQKCQWKNCNKINCSKPWHKPYLKTDLVYKLTPVLVTTGWAEVIFGCILLVLVVAYDEEFDRLYGVEQSKTISLLSFGALVGITLGGVVLLVSILLSKRAILWFYVIASTFLCVYIFVVSVIMIQYAMYNAPYTSAEKNFLLGKAAIIGLLTLFGSVVHFIQTVTVFTYYNLKYIHPMLFYCHQTS